LRFNTGERERSGGGGGGGGGGGRGGATGFLGAHLTPVSVGFFSRGHEGVNSISYHFFFFFFSFPVHPSAHLDPRVLFSFPSAAAAAAAAAADDDYNPVLRLTTPEEESNTCSIRSLSISPKFYEMPPGLCDEKHKPEEKKIVPAD